jgi:hypothetical protein
MARSAYREAVQHFEQALGCITHLAETSDTLARAIDIRVNLRGALIPIGESARGLERLIEADVLARRLREPRRLAWLATLLTHHL